MELMSFLLLWTAVLFTPKAFGDPMLRKFGYHALKYNNTLKLRQSLNKRALQSNWNLASTAIPEDSITDDTCKHCFDCISRVKKMYRSQTYMLHKHLPDVEDSFMPVPNKTPHVDVSEETANYNEIPRQKRETDTAVKPEDTGKSKKSKNKKTKPVTVTKYNVGGEIAALKVKEPSTRFLGENFSDSVCQVYSINKAYPCGSPEGDMILSATKRKGNKKSKNENKNENKKKSTSTERTKVVLASFRKREVDNSHVPDTFMSSFEEMYQL